MSRMILTFEGDVLLLQRKMMDWSHLDAGSVLTFMLQNFTLVGDEASVEPTEPFEKKEYKSCPC